MGALRSAHDVTSWSSYDTGQMVEIESTSENCPDGTKPKLERKRGDPPSPLLPGKPADQPRE